SRVRFAQEADDLFFGESFLHIQSPCVVDWTLKSRATQYRGDVEVIVNVKGHFVIVDSQLEVNGVAYYMTRDPYVGPRGVQSTLLQTVMSQGVNAVIVGR
ncbi:hypothetical protein, partial [Chromobacterium violaceum]|uniref:hypothetical protein n=1 Tax=Chromobacterium violaceum TaxID=536 RepID=UPI001C37FF6E